MEKLIRLTQKGFQTFNHNQKSVMVFFNGKPLSASVNELPKYMKEEIGDKMPEKVFGQKYIGNGKIFNVFKGNCSHSKPFQFENIEKAIEAFKQVRTKKEKAKVFCGNNWIGNIINDEYQPLEKPIMQLL